MKPDPHNYRLPLLAVGAFCATMFLYAAFVLTMDYLSQQRAKEASPV